MTATVGFIGTGNMGAALARAVCKTVPPQQVLLANRTPAKAEALAEELGCAAGTNEEVARACRLIFLGVKPQVMGEMLASLTPVLKEREDCFVLVTMAAGLTWARIREMAGVDCPVIRVMPNTPAAIGEGVLQFCGLGTTEEDMASFRNLMAPAGLVDQVPEGLIDAASCVSGCGPTGSTRTGSTPPALCPAAAPLLPTCSWRPWRTAGWPAACPGTRRWPTPPRCWPGRPGWCWRPALTPVP